MSTKQRDFALNWHKAPDRSIAWKPSTVAALKISALQTVVWRQMLGRDARCAAKKHSARLIGLAERLSKGKKGIFG